MLRSPIHLVNCSGKIDTAVEPLAESYRAGLPSVSRMVVPVTGRSLVSTLDVGSHFSFSPCKV